MRLSHFIFPLAIILFFSQCVQTAILKYKAHRGDYSAGEKLAKQYYYGYRSNCLLPPLPCKQKPLKAIECLELADSLNSIHDDFLKLIKNDSCITFDMDNHPIKWYYKKKVLSIPEYSETTISDSWNLIKPIAKEVHVLVVVKPNCHFNDESDYELILKTNYEAFTNLDTLVWVGDNSDHIDKLPEKVLSLPSLKVLYMFGMIVDTSITKQFYSYNPKLEIDTLRSLPEPKDSPAHIIWKYIGY
jgi:hypothetical protein